MRQIIPLPSPLQLELPLMLDSSITDEFDNYVYTIIRTTYEIIVNPSKIDDLTEERIKALKKNAIESTEIFRSYYQESTAREWVERANNNFFNVFNVDEKLSKIHEMFETQCILVKIDPETYDYICCIRKFDYVKNELHGALLSC